MIWADISTLDEVGGVGVLRLRSCDLERLERSRDLLWFLQTSGGLINNLGKKNPQSAYLSRSLDRSRRLDFSLLLRRSLDFLWRSLLRLRDLMTVAIYEKMAIHVSNRSYLLRRSLSRDLSRSLECLSVRLRLSLSFSRSRSFSLSLCFDMIIN